MNLILPMLNSFPSQTWGALGGALNETPDRTRQGLFDALPTLFAGLIGKGSTPAGAASLLTLLKNNPVDLDRLSNPAAVTEPHLLAQGGQIAHTVLGDGYDSAATAISRHSGIGMNAAQSLLGLAAPLALGGIAKAAPSNGFTAEGLMRFLQGQRDDVTASAPAGLSLPRFLERPATTTSTARVYSEPARTTTTVQKRNGWMPWVLGLAVLALGALALSRCASNRVVEVPPAPVVEAPRVVTPAVPAAPSLTLPGGIQLNVLPGSIGYNLATFLNGSEAAPRTFRFDNLNFDTNDVVVTPESTATLDAIATTLRAYPNAQVRLEGHTDSTGDRAANVALSRARANSVAQALITRGVDAGRITFTGLGPDRPIASNDTEAGRAENRRLELTVVRK